MSQEAYSNSVDLFRFWISLWILYVCAYGFNSICQHYMSNQHTNNTTNPFLARTAIILGDMKRKRKANYAMVVYNEAFASPMYWADANDMHRDTQFFESLCIVMCCNELNVCVFVYDCVCSSSLECLTVVLA